MAEHIVSGGGNALNAFLGNETAYTDNDLILVEPGVYSHVLFNKYRKNVVVRSTEGQEKTIIDGEGMYPCFRNNYTNNGYIYTIDGFSLSNGYVSTDVSADNLVPGTWMEAGGYGACRFLNCGFYDCSAFSLSANLNSRLGIAFTNTTQQYPSYTYFKNCELSGNVSNINNMFNGHFLNCDIHHNHYYKSQQGDRFAATGTFYACRIHHNEMSGIWGGASYADCLIYRNHGNDNWFNERSKVINSTFANNVGISHLDNGFGGHTYYKNCVFYKNFRKDGVTRSSANWYSNQRGTININNYFDQLSTTMTWYTPMTSALVSGDAFLPGVNFGFVDEENDDYHLRPDSILISAGTNYRMSDFEMLTSSDKNNLTALERYIDLFGNTDFDGKPFDEEHPSVGAYQFAAEKSNLPNKVYPFGTREEKELVPLYDAEVEYLESTGTQWIDTGYVPTHDTEFNLRFSPNVLRGDGGIVPVHGNAYSTKNYPSADQAPVTLWHTNDTNNRFFYSPVMFSNWVVGETYDVRQGIAGLWINDSKIGEYSSLRTPPPEPMWLFRYYNSGNELFGKFKLFYWKAWQNGVLVRDFVPVRVGSVGYLFDRVSGILFGNAGTGSFVLGPDVQS